MRSNSIVLIKMSWLFLGMFDVNHHWVKDENNSSIISSIGMLSINPLQQKMSRSKSSLYDINLAINGTDTYVVYQLSDFNVQLFLSHDQYMF